MKAANIKYVSLANNHILDFESQGLLDTIKRLDNAEIMHAGAGRNLAEAREPGILDIKGIKFGFLSYTDNEPAFAASNQCSGTNYIPISS